MKQTTSYTAILISFFMASCGLAPAPNNNPGNKKYSDLTDIVCKDKGGDTDGYTICNADEIAASHLGPTCINTPDCNNNDVGDDEESETESKGINPLWVLAGIVAGGVGEAVWQPIGNNVTPWFKGQNQQITTANGDVIKIDGRQVEFAESKFQFANRGSTKYIMHYSKVVYDDDVTGSYNGVDFRLNSQTYQCVIAKFAEGAITQNNDNTDATVQFVIAAKKRKVTVTSEEKQFENKCLKDSEWEEGVYISGEKDNNRVQIKVREKSAKTIGYTYTGDKFFRKTNTARFGNLTNLSGDVTTEIVNSGGTSGLHIIVKTETPDLSTNMKNAYAACTDASCKAKLLMQVTNTGDKVKFYTETEKKEE